ncbi:TRAP transporter substrate-binding protein [Oceanicola sp. 502str15]|uniref:TRAP transporter substrate-binding protein n=1 Tax=Oceanicola sp. 502str15 TaxID=2696061 RepID=UPI0020957A08|nr:TRAP transporter substrate-binding protein [Oceanicola sp. 502str15]MCO6381275.1 DctP family TRAP transporter solute-binding subunit [Oceanicola sp. 502str15]
MTAPLRLALASAALAVAASASAAQEVTLRLGHVEAPASTTHVMLEKVAEMVSEKTDGAVALQIFPQSQLGSQREMTEAVQFGALDATAGPVAFMGGFNPVASIMDIPFLYPADPEKAQAIRESGFSDAFCESFNSRGVTCVSHYPNGTKQFTSSKPIETVAEFEGQSFRVMESAVLVESMGAIGVKGVPIPFGELYTALQTGVVDGEENPLDTIFNMKFFEVQDYLALSNHGAIENVVLFSPMVWTGLDESHREAISSSLQEIIPEMMAHKAAAGETSLEAIRAAEVTVIEPSAEEIAALREKMFPAARDAFLARSGEEGAKLFEAYQAAYDAVMN